MRRILSTSDLKRLQATEADYLVRVVSLFWLSVPINSTMVQLQDLSPPPDRHLMRGRGNDVLLLIPVQPTSSLTYHIYYYCFRKETDRWANEIYGL